MIVQDVLAQKVFGVTDENFTSISLEIFQYQAKENAVYKKFLQTLDILPASIKTPESIPFLPAELFKTQKIITGSKLPALYFESSGTSDQVRSRHYITDPALYEDSIKKCFELFYGDITQYCFLALLPSYSEREHASLIYMCNRLMHWSGHPANGFYAGDMHQLAVILQEQTDSGSKTILIGVAFALLDFALQFPIKLRNCIIMETGGMKGRKKEITRAALHDILCRAFHIPAVHSEYGMTELLSQAYAREHGKFICPPWMKILIRDAEDPFAILPANTTGCINIIDLANVYSCSFIATQDIGKIHPDNSFEVLGRYDLSDLRGCNLLFA